MYDNKESVLLTREAHYEGMFDCIIAHVTQSPVLVPSPDIGLIIGGSKLQPSNLMGGLSDMTWEGDPLASPC